MTPLSDSDLKIIDQVICEGDPSPDAPRWAWAEFQTIVANLLAADGSDPDVALMTWGWKSVPMIPLDYDPRVPPTGEERRDV